ncbi:MAG: hypothetical protein WD431_04410 [Cyclobacteriaceae bacterium]
MKTHWLWILLACVAPILLIFLLPLFGITADLTFFLFLIIFFIAHLFMMRSHSHEHGGNHRLEEQGKGGQQTKHSHH